MHNLALLSEISVRWSFTDGDHRYHGHVPACLISTSVSHNLYFARRFRLGFLVTLFGSVLARILMYFYPVRYMALFELRIIPLS